MEEEQQRGVLELTDVHGNKYKVADIGGFRFPVFPTINDYHQHGRNIRDMELHPDDVFIVNFPKTGTHWLTSIVTMLMKGSTEDYGQTSSGWVFLDRIPLSSPSALPPPDRPRIIFTHVPFDFLPRQVKEKNVKLVYAERNPKDTWVSFFNFMTKLNFFQSSWTHFFDQMLTSGYWYGDWFDFVLQWERDIERERAAGHPIFVNHFEELKKSPVEQIEKLDKFLGYNRGRELCEQIAKACNFSNMKSAISKQDGSKIHKGFNVKMMRKGEVADWKNWFTVAQNERFDHEYSARMKGSKLKYSFE